MKEYTLKTKQGKTDYTYSTKAETLNEAVNNLFMNLKNYKWTKDQVREAINAS